MTSKYRWIRHHGETLYEVGILDDGTLHNPRGYPEHIVREAVLEAEERGRQRRSRAAQKAAQTRARRKEKRVDLVARRIVEGREWGPASSCVICGRGLGDPESVQRGIGSECWQAVMRKIERALDMRATRPKPPGHDGGKPR